MRTSNLAAFRASVHKCLVWTVTCVPVIAIWLYDEPEPPIDGVDYGVTAITLLIAAWSTWQAKTVARMYLGAPPRWPWWRPLATIYWSGRRPGDPETTQSLKVLRSLSAYIRLLWVLLVVYTLYRLISGLVRG